MAVRDDISVIWSLSPRIITVAAPSTEITIQDLHDTLRDIEDEPHNLTHGSIAASGSIIETAGKEPLGGGVTVGLTATLQNAVLAFEARQIIRTSGTVTTGDATGRVLTDSAGTFVTDGVTQGDWLVNMTDGSGATVLFVNSETEIITDILDGGTDNQFDSADVYRIWPVIQVGVSGGNLVAVDDVAADLDPILPTFGTQVVRTSSSSATLQELADIQYSSFGGGVTVDPLSSFTGTFYPRGTPREPVNNFTDALAIATTRGFTTIFVIGDATVPAGVFQNFNFMGSGVTESTITVAGAALVDGASFTQCQLEGTLDGDVFINDCVVDDLTFVDGTVQNSTLIGTITLSGSQDAALVNCRDGTPGTDLPHIDLNGSGSALNVQGWAGGIRLQNKSGVEPVALDLNSGHVILDSDVTQGTITLRGVGTLDDNSTGTTVVDTSALINKRDLFQQIVPGVYIDVANGVSGTAEGVGLPQTPVDNITDARTIADRDGYTTYIIRGTITLATAHTNWTFVGIGEILSEVDMNGQDISGSVFTLCSITGAQGGAGVVEVVDGRLRAATNLNGVFRNCGLPNTVSVANSSATIFTKCFAGPEAGGPVVFTAGTNCNVVFRDWAGPIDVRSVTAGCTVAVCLDPGEAIIGATNTGGTITVRGQGSVTNTSTADVIIHTIDSKVQLVEATIAAGSTTEEVRTDRTEANNYWDHVTVLVYDGDTVAVPRRVLEYTNTNGALFLADPLPFTPAVGDRVTILATVTQDTGRGT